MLGQLYSIPASPVGELREQASSSGQSRSSGVCGRNEKWGRREEAKKSAEEEGADKGRKEEGRE